MTTAQIIGWKTYAVAVIAIIAGLVAWTQGYVGDGLKGIIAGFALISLRDAVSKILRAIEDNRAALDNMRAAIDTHWKTNSRG
jgi:hypothetical protein